MRLRLMLLLAVALLAGAGSCKRKHSNDSGPADPPPQPPPGSVFESYVPAGTAPGASINLVVGISENVTLAEMQALYTRFLNVNISIYNVTEGQIRIGDISISDNTHPGTTSSQYATINSSAVDIVAWPPAQFNGPGGAFVALPPGRNGRFMGIPTNASNTTLLHEFGHFLFDLSWAPAPILVDEYGTAPADSACIQELTFTPLRWCFSDNHQAQASQPTSCWQQILADYPLFTYANTNVSALPPADPVVTYTDTP